MRRTVLWLGVFLCLLAAAGRECRAEEVTFEEAFSTKAEPRALHYLVVVEGHGTVHTLEVWRDGELRLKRRMDQAVETFVFREAGDDEFRMSILDLRKRLRTEVNRTSLYRVGNFTDWFDLAHGLRRSPGGGTVREAQAPAGAPQDIPECRWYDLIEVGRTSHVCWSLRAGIPMAVQAESGELLWKVTELDTLPISPSVFEIHDEGFIRNDAGQEISGD
jgi:hypothetical protein